METTDYSVQIEETVSELLDAMKHRGVSDEDLARIRDAFEFAREAHSGQFRKTGQPYIIHPVAVARIVADELKLGANPVIAAFLHDVVEDTPHPIEEIKERFGDDVAFLVNVVTKKKKDKYSQSKQIDNFKQMLESINYDIRALLIKLSDRLHNMRTLSSMRGDKQMKIAGETDFFYAPLANRLGLYYIKCELEDLSFKYRCPREYSQVEGQLEQYKQNESERISQFVSHIDSLIESHHIKVDTEYVFRPPYSCWKKMQESGGDFQHIEGKYYIRMIFDDPYPLSEKDMSLKIYSILSDGFKEKPGSVTNYIDNPKENGYQSFHVKLLSEQGQWEEVHIASSRMLKNNRLGCASERSEENVQLWLDKFKEHLKDMAFHVGEIGFMEGVTSSFYNDDIMVFTPAGKGIILPKNATALDFAFEIHRNVGSHAQYARINGKFCSVMTVLQRGDCVEIHTSENVMIQSEWLSHVSTYKAKRSIRSFLIHQVKSNIVRCHKCLPLPGDEVVGFRNSDGTISIHKRNCHTAISLASQYADSIEQSVSFDQSPSVSYPVQVSFLSVDRFHLLWDIVGVIAESLKLSMREIKVQSADCIANCTIVLLVHSVSELEQAIASISDIPGVEEVHCLNLPE